MDKKTITQWKQRYELSQSTDQPNNELTIYLGKKYRKIRVYGNLKDKEEAQGKAPADLLKLFDQLTKYDHPDAKPWLPEKMELMFWPYEYAPQKSLEWPKDWPDLNSPETIKRASLYSVFFPSNKMTELRTILKKMKPKGAILINGRKMALSTRVPFPNEKIWMKK